ncbi:unnamed protein product [Closterium sp. Naga37s-1]|nr:unnamed protein product [Closterium sp. Naga37s-1]
MPFETTKVKCQKLCPSLSQFACIKGNLDVALILLDAGADLYATSDDKGNALEYAQEWGTEDMVDFLLVRAATESNK